MKPIRGAKMKLYSNGPGQMTNIAAIPIYSKDLNRNTF